MSILSDIGTKIGTELKTKFDKTGGFVNGNLTISNSYLNFSGSIAITPQTAAAIYRPLDNTLAFSTANVERLRIDSSGNVGIGIATPVNKLHIDVATGGGLTIEANANVDIDLRFRENGVNKWNIAYDASESAMLMYNNTLGTAVQTWSNTGDSTFTGNVGIGATPQSTLDISQDGGSTLILRGAGNQAFDVNTIEFRDRHNASIFGAEGQLGGFIKSIRSGSSGEHYLTFGTTNADGDAIERMRINSSGLLLLGKTDSGLEISGLQLDPGGNIQLSNPSTTQGHEFMIINNNITGTHTNSMLQFRRNSVVKGTITMDDTSVTYGSNSDYRLKENDIEITDGITRVKALRPIRFNFKSEVTKTVDGFFAHEAQVIVPESVQGTKDEMDEDGTTPKHQGIDQSKLVPLLTAALKEAITKIESMEALLVAKGIITQLEADAL